MHVLVLSLEMPLQTRFLRRAFRYENIGADQSSIENLIKIWYGQYDAIVVPMTHWDESSFSALQRSILQLGKIPTIFTGKIAPPDPIQKRITQTTFFEFVGSQRPFNELVQKLQKMMRSNRRTKIQTQKLQVGELSIDLEKRQVRRKKQMLKLRNKEFALLACLMNNAGKVLTRTYLLEQVWDRNANLLSNTVDVHMSRLRKKIDRGFRKSMIVTIPCTGYKLIEK